jgi:transposase
MIMKYFEETGMDQTVVIETTSSWYWLSDLLESRKMELVLAHAKELKAIANAKVKTYKVDSSTLADLLRADLVSPAHKISKELRGLRDTMRMRLRLVQKRTSCYNSIHRIAEKFNCDMEVELSKRTMPEELPEEYRTQTELYYQQSELLDEQIKLIEKQLRTRLRTNEDIERMQTVPGIGMITAYSVYLEIDGIERFPAVKNFLAYCRLVPGAKDSNKTKRHRSGNKEGNVYLKISFTNAAVHSIRYGEEIRKFCYKMLRRTNKSIALTLVAKELAKIAYYILKDRTEYRGFRQSRK